jgi:hypothetical protein
MSDERMSEGPTAEEAARAAAPVLPTIKMTFPSGGKNGKSAPKVEGEEHLKSIARAPGSAWTVTRVSVPPEYRGATTGLLPITLTGSEFASPPTLHERLGAGTYEFASGEKRYVVELATRTPPVEYGEEEGEGMVVVTPAGPVSVKVPRGGALAPQHLPMAYGAPPWQGYAPPWGAPAAPSAADLAKAVAEANRPVLDAFAKVLERLDKGQGEASAVMLQMKQLEVAAAKEERLAREKEAEEARKAKEAEVREMRALETAKAEKAAAAQVEIAKANADAARESARVQADAQRAVAQAQVESAKESARAAIEAAKDRAAHEREFMERMMEVHAAPREDPIETYVKYQKLLHGGAPDGIAGALVAAGPSLVRALGEELRALKATTANVVVLGPDGQPVGQAVTTLPAPASPAAASIAPDPNAAQRRRKELLDAVATFRAGFEQRRAPEEVAAALARGAPTVAAWMKQSDPLGLLKQLDDLLERPEFTAAEKEVARATKAALATDDGVAWALKVFGAVRGGAA